MHVTKYIGQDVNDKQKDLQVKKSQKNPENQTSTEWNIMNDMKNHSWDSNLSTFCVSRYSLYLVGISMFHTLHDLVHIRNYTYYTYIQTTAATNRSCDSEHRFTPISETIKTIQGKPMGKK
jgi:hypothetical protein